jgi:hypothetical protein
VQFTVNIMPLAVAVGIVSGAIIGAATVWARVTKPLRQLLTEVRLMMADFQGTPARPGVRAVPGNLERLQILEDAVAAIDRELRTNGGGSLRDLVLRVAAQQRVMSTHVGAPVMPPRPEEAVVIATPAADWTQTGWPPNHAVEQHAA